MIKLAMPKGIEDARPAISPCVRALELPPEFEAVTRGEGVVLVDIALIGKGIYVANITLVERGAEAEELDVALVLWLVILS